MAACKIAELPQPTYSVENPGSTDDGKNPAPFGGEGRSKLGAYQDQLISRR